VHHPFTDDDEDPNDHSSEGDSNSSDAWTASTSSQEATSRKRLDNEEGASKKK
jgi:fatty-acid desaturase